MNRAEREFFHKSESPKSNSTGKCASCNALFPLEYFECPQCDIDFHSVKMNFEI